MLCKTKLVGNRSAASSPVTPSSRKKSCTGSWKDNRAGQFLPMTSLGAWAEKMKRGNEPSELQNYQSLISKKSHIKKQL